MNKKILAQEFIGTKVKIIDSTNKLLVGFEGIIINETKNTFVIKTNGGEKTVLKSVIKIELPNGSIVDGKKLVKRSEQRLKG
jgi:ribonuclease P protein subunit POP4